jgi:hypothetical protein
MRQDLKAADFVSAADRAVRGAGFGGQRARFKFREGLAQAGRRFRESTLDGKHSEDNAAATSVES